MKPINYINKRLVRELALKVSKDYRQGKFTRVSKQFLEEVNARVAEHIAFKVQHAPSKGRTL